MYESCGHHLVYIRRSGQIFSVGNAHCSLRIPGQPESRELPGGFRRKEITIGGAYVRPRRDTRAAAQHELVAHELAVVLAERSSGRSIAGIGGILAARPFPYVPVELPQRCGSCPGRSVRSACAVRAGRPGMHGGVFQKMRFLNGRGAREHRHLPFLFRGETGPLPSGHRRLPRNS